MDDLWRIQLLGGLAARRGDVTEDHFRTQKTATLLAYLALNADRRHSREVLCEMLWPDSQPRKGKACLSTELSSLRGMLEPSGLESGSVIVADNFQIGLAPSAIRTDVSAFFAAFDAAKGATGPESVAHLRSAARLGRGELLPGMYDDWVIAERYRIGEAYLRTLVDLAEAVRETDPSEAIDCLQIAVATEPTREANQQALLRMLVAARRFGEAMRSYERLVEALAEFGDTPSPETTALVAGLRPVKDPPLPEAPRGVGEPSATEAVQARQPPVGTVTLVAAEVLEDGVREVLRASVTEHGGHEYDGSSRLLLAGFLRSSDALLVASRAREVGAGLRVAIDTVETDGRGGFGNKHPAVALQRLIAAGDVGRALCSAEAAALAGRYLGPDLELAPLGAYELRPGGTFDQVYEVVSAGESGDRPPLAGTSRKPQLPTPFARMYGRERELERLAVLLSPGGPRLVILHGWGGVGKTRLAAEAAQQATGRFRGNVYFVHLDEVAEPDRMLTAIIKALGQRPLGSDPIAQIVSAIGENPSLVVLDGAERLFPAADATLRALLEAGGAVHLLVTTRRLPQVVGSEIVPLEPLPLPSKDAPIDDLAAFPSVALYVARAQQARPEFQLTPPISEDVAALCRFLDGIPLAIELVAARAHVFTPAELLRHLEDAAKVERGAGQAALKKMWAAARTSYDLLSPGLQGFFAQLGVFRGGWTSDDAEAVTGDALASDHLEMLADDGLVRPGLVGDRTRFDMYGVLREYARSHLGTDRRAAVEEAHARHYADLAETAARELRGPHQADWLDRLDAERANLLAAMDWAASGGEPVVGLRTAASLWRLWYLRGPYREGLRLLERALAQSSEPTETTALALHGAGSLAYMLGDLGKSRDYLTQSIELSEALGANWLLAHSVNNLALCTYEAGDVEATEPLLRRSLAIKIENGDKPGEATTLLNLGLVSFELGDHDEAERLMSQSLALRRQIGSTPEVMESLVHLGFFMAMSGRREEGDDVLSQAIVSIRASGDRTHLGTALRLRGIVRGVTDEAEADLVEALDLARREGDKRLECECIGSLGRRLAVAGEPDLARPMLEASAVVAAETGFHVGTTLAASSLAMCAVQTSEWAVARAPLREALDRSQRATPSASEQLMVVDMIAAGLAAVDRGQALALAARVGNVRGLLGIPRSPEFVAWMQRFLEIEDGAVESAPQPSRGREELRGLLGEAWEVLDGLLLERS